MEEIHVSPDVYTRIKAEKWTKFFGRLTGMVLAMGIVIALVAVTVDRNNLQDELFCRSTASATVNRAMATRDNLVVEALIAVAEGNDVDLLATVPRLKTASSDVNVAIKAQGEALEGCSK